MCPPSGKTRSPKTLVGVPKEHGTIGRLQFILSSSPFCFLRLEFADELQHHDNQEPFFNQGEHRSGVGGRGRWSGPCLPWEVCWRQSGLLLHGEFGGVSQEGWAYVGMDGFQFVGGLVHMPYFHVHPQYRTVLSKGPPFSWLLEGFSVQCRGSVV